MIALASGAEGTVDIIDASGRRIRSLFTGRTWSGEVRLRWDGRDERGRAVPAGFYWVRARSQGRVAARAVVRVR